MTKKLIGEVPVKIPLNREGKFQSDVLPRSKRHEDKLRKVVCLKFLTGMSTRTLSLISKQLLGRKISAGEVCRANQDLSEAVEQWRTRSLEA